MSHLEPTYLRYIYDSLIKGSIHPENAAELPDGLIGLYEEAFDERNAVVERQKLLKRFAIWALLKKEVSAAFVAEVLEEKEEDVLDFISTHSAWFNSPVSGKYQLYHERLKVYLLQKFSENEVYILHEHLLERLENAVNEQKSDELEFYGLEFLAFHYLVQSMIVSDGTKLINFVYDVEYWQRQIHISKAFTWTRNNLGVAMFWASKFSDEEVVSCGLKIAKLHKMEQNSGPQILELLRQDEIETVLKRIEDFGGYDRIGLQRKFILYMACFNELISLKSESYPSRKRNIESLLKHFDSVIPLDFSLLNWNEFFSSLIVYRLVLEMKALDIDGVLLFSRTKLWDSSWISTNKNSILIDTDLISKLVECIQDNKEKNFCLGRLCTFFAKQENWTEARKQLEKITNDNLAGAAYLELFKLSDQVSFLQDYEFCFDRIESETHRIQLEIEKANIYVQKGGLKDHALLPKIEQSIELIREFDVKSGFYLSLGNILEDDLMRRKFYNKAFHSATQISARIIKSRKLINVAENYIIKGNFYEANHVLNAIDELYWRTYACIKSALLSFKLGNEKETEFLVEAALTTFGMIKDFEVKQQIIYDLAPIFVKLKKTEVALDLINQIESSSWKNSILRELSKEFVLENDWSSALNCLEQIKDEYEKSNACLEMCIALYETNDLLNLSRFYMSQNLFTKRMITSELVNRSLYLQDSGYILQFFDQLNDDQLKREALLSYIKHPYHQDIDVNFQKILILLLEKIDDRSLEFDMFLSSISNNSVSNGKTELGLSIWDTMTGSVLKDKAIRDIAFSAAMKSVEDADLVLKSIKDPYGHFITLIDLSYKLKDNGHSTGMRKMLNSACERVNTIDLSLLEISKFDLIKVLLYCELVEKAKEVLLSIQNDNYKALALAQFAVFSLNNEKSNYYQHYWQEALDCNNEINDKQIRLNNLFDLYCLVIKEGHIELISYSDLDMFTDRKSDELNIEIAKVLASKREYSKVDELIKQMKDPNLLDSLYIELVKTKIGQGTSHLDNNYLEKISRRENLDKALLYIIDALLENGMLSEAGEVSNKLHSTLIKDEVLRKIVSNCYQREHFMFAKEKSQFILSSQLNSTAYEELGRNSIKHLNNQWDWDLLIRFKAFDLDDFICLGMLKEINLFMFTEKTVSKILPLYHHDFNILQHTLNKFFLKTLFDGTKLNRDYSDMEETLNIQWAIDIKNQLPN
jgi:predicted negative regulator of RcsB-dependent stress response